MAIFAKQITANISGGAPPYSVLWERVSGDVNINVDTNNVHNPSFIYSGSYRSDVAAVWKAIVTDANNTVQEQTVNITFTPVDELIVSKVDIINMFESTTNGIGSIPLSLTVSGGIAPYTYEWVRGSSNVTFYDPNTSELVTPNTTANSSLSNTSILNPVVSSIVNNDTTVESWVLTVTDSLGTTKVHDVKFIFRHYTALSGSVPQPTTTDHYSGSDTVHTFNKSITATAGGGIGTLSYEWEPVLPNPVGSYVDNVSAILNLEFILSDGSTINEAWKCTVRDMAGNSIVLTHTFDLSVVTVPSIVVSHSPTPFVMDSAADFNY